MAVTLNPKAFYHARSISLPSRPHPFIPEFNEKLRRVQDSEPLSSSLMSQRLPGLMDLIDCVENLLMLPLSQQILTQHRQEKWVDELLEGSLGLLDACDTAKDVLSQIRDHASKLLSALRRRRVNECKTSTGVDEYLTSRKKGMKAMQKALKNLKVMKNKCSFSPLNTDPEAVSLVCMLREVEMVTLTLLESLLSSISGSTLRSKPSSWSLVSRLVHHKQVACEEAAPAEITEFEKVDSALSSLIHHRGKSVNLALLDDMQKEVGQLEQSIQNLEGGLEFLSRRLIKTRVSLLNILNH